MDEFGHLKNYFTIRDSTEWWFKDDTSRISNKSNDYKGFQRWKTFMESRVDNSGSLSTYSNAYVSAINNIKTRDNTNSINVDWTCVGPIKNESSDEASLLGIVTSLKVVNKDTIYAGGGTGGLFVTYNGGANWKCLTDFEGVTGVESIEVNPRKPGTIYIGTGFFTWGREYCRGVMKSIDNGITWNETALNTASFNKNFVISGTCQNKINPDTLLALVNFEFKAGARIMRTIDGGQNWTNVLPEQYLLEDFKKIEASPTDCNTMYVSGTKVLKTIDGGDTWQDITPNILNIHTNKITRATTAINKFDPNKVFVVLERYTIVPRGFAKVNYIEFHISYDGGNSFTVLSSKPQGNCPNFIYYKMETVWSSKHPDVFYVGGRELIKYTLVNGDLTPTYLPQKYHVDIRHIESSVRQVDSPFGNVTFGDIWFGTDGGVSHITEFDNSYDLEEITGEGLNITQYYGFDIPRGNSHVIMGGTQDGNYDLYDGQNWFNRGGDVGEVVIDYENPEVAYKVVFAIAPYLFKTVNGGMKWSEVFRFEEEENRRNDAPLEMSGMDPKKLLIGGTDVWMSTDGAATFNRKSEFDSNDALKVIRLAPSNENIIYAANHNPYWGITTKIKLRRGVMDNQGFVTWYDITPRPPAPLNLYGVGIFDLAVDPYDENIFYVALDRNIADKKVFKGTVTLNNGVPTVEWTNMSQGLTNLPVNCIEFYKGNDHADIFVGTDDGVYYWDQSMNEWTPFGVGLPIVSVSDLEINYVHNKLYASTFGRGMYKADLCNLYPVEDITIREAQTWNNNTRITGNVTIMPEAKLTIKGEVKMAPGKTIVVEIGGMLIVDGGKITNSCEFRPWRGIRVKGTDKQPQNPLYQGLVSLKNNATIENAEIGIHSTNNTKPYTGGGIIMANNAIFKNNLISVQMEKYYGSNIANFVQCTFITDDDFYSSHFKPESFIVLNEVSNVKILGCELKNTQKNSSFEANGIGVTSFNSNFTLDHNCISSGLNNCLKYKRNILSGLNYGVVAYGGYSTKTFKVNHTTFNNNQTALYASGVYNAEIKWDSILMPDTDLIGIYFDQCSGYILEENYFRSTHPLGRSRGLTINNSSDQPNFIYRNTFSRMEYGVIAQNKNRSRDGSRGLQIKCNDFDEIGYSIAVLSDNISNSDGIPAIDGIPNQGSNEDCTKPAGNIFTIDYYLPGSSDILNECKEIEYFHHNPTDNQNVVPKNPVNVTLRRTEWDLVYNTCCPEKTTGGGSGTIDSETENYKISADSISNTLSLLVDDGSTTDKVFMVNSASPNESLTIQEDLLLTSPFLSDTVIISSIEREDLLNNAMIRDIMVANPQGVKSQGVMQTLESRIEPMPDYLMDEILEGLQTISAKELLEIQGNLNYSFYSYGLNRLLSQTLNDTSLLINDSIVSLLQLDATPYSLMRVAWFMIENGDTTGAINKVDSILADTLTEHESYELNQQKTLMLWLIENPVIDSTSVEDLTYFLQSGSQLVSSYARSVMITNDFLDYNEPYLVPQLLKNDVIRQVKRVADARSYVKVFPNPAKDYITVSYNSSIVNSNSEIIILDDSGKIVNRISISKQSDQFIINTQKLTSGVYLIKLLNNNKTTAKEKFIIVN